MQQGEFIALWLPDGRAVTRWPEQKANATNAVTTTSKDGMAKALAPKFPADKLRSIGVFQFVGWADELAETSGEKPRGREMLPIPVVAFASSLSRDEAERRLFEIADLVHGSTDDGQYMVEVFIRSRTPIQDEGLRRRVLDQPKRPRGPYRES